MRSVACNNDNSVYLYFVIMYPDPYFYLIPGLYLSNHLKYYAIMKTAFLWGGGGEYSVQVVHMYVRYCVHTSILRMSVRT